MTTAAFSRQPKLIFWLGTLVWQSHGDQHHGDETCGWRPACQGHRMVLHHSLWSGKYKIDWTNSTNLIFTQHWLQWTQKKKCWGTLLPFPSSPPTSRNVCVGGLLAYLSAPTFLPFGLLASLFHSFPSIYFSMYFLSLRNLYLILQELGLSFMYNSAVYTLVVFEGCINICGVMNKLLGKLVWVGPG